MMKCDKITQIFLRCQFIKICNLTDGHIKFNENMKYLAFETKLI